MCAIYSAGSAELERGEAFHVKERDCSTPGSVEPQSHAKAGTTSPMGGIPMSLWPVEFRVPCGQREQTWTIVLQHGVRGGTFEDMMDKPTSG